VNWEVPVGKWRGEVAFLLGGGPSLKGFDANRLKGRGRVIAINDAGLDLAPWADILYFSDGWERWYGWNRHRLDEFKGWEIVTRVRVGDPRVRELGHKPRQAISRNPKFLSGFCSGGAAINLAYLLGARVIVLMGYDMRPGNWHDNHKAPPNKKQHRAKFIPHIEWMAPELEAEGVVVLNTNPRSALRCFPFADIEELLSMDQLAAIEAEKYRRIWEREEYRRVSPGMMETERAWRVCGMEPGQTLHDFGAGTGRAARRFADKGMSVLAIDHADNALEVAVPFIKTCLWDMQDLPEADHGFCCDVMEHIPEQRVQDTLAAIRAKVRKSCYFRIATRPDQLGKLIGQPLHLTVRSGEWWRRQVEGHFDLVDVIEMNPRDVMLLARP